MKAPRAVLPYAEVRARPLGRTAPGLPLEELSDARPAAEDWLFDTPRGVAAAASLVELDP